MKFYTFDNTNMKTTTDGYVLYDFFEKTMVNNEQLAYNTYTVPEEFDCRLDLVCKHIYGSTDYMEELMTQNGILNPFSVKAGDVLYYAHSANELAVMYETDKDVNEENKEKILSANKNKSTTLKPGTVLPPSIKPDNLKPVDVNYNKKKITVINKFR